ncbi:hypothetical protein QAD02_006096 [Eretmocerus hayati]|uniref:Uncharacterized protein n=1 Tax=Eretmocerus hayati TaxID=131215 RepID=A0ACC2N020_9HYME|nr:hypothetical protein QAD02_006096 [Eretmocerus hayati]
MEVFEVSTGAFVGAYGENTAGNAAGTVDVVDEFDVVTPGDGSPDGIVAGDVICGIADVGVFTGLAVVLFVDVGGRAGGNAGGTVDVVAGSDVVTLGDGSPDGIVAGNVICEIAGVGVFTGLAVVLLVDVGGRADGNAGGTVDVVAGSDVVTPGNGSPDGIVAGNVICGIAGVGVFTGLAVVLLVDVGSPADGNAGGTVDVVAGSDVVTPGNGSPDGIVAGNVICGIAGVGVFTGLAVVLLVDVGGRAGGNAGGTVDVVDEFDVVTPGDGSPDGIVAGNVICGIAGVEVFTGLAVVLLVDVGSPADGNAGGTVDVVAGSDVVTLGDGSPDGIVAGNVICGIAGVGVFTGLAVVLLVDVGGRAGGNAGGTVDVVDEFDVVTPGDGSPDGIVAGNVICGIAGVEVFTGLAVVLLVDVGSPADGNAGGTVDVVAGSDVVTPGNGSPYGIVAGNVICGIAGVGVFTGLAVVLLVDVGSPADGNAGGTVDVVAGSDVVTPGNGSPDGIVAGNVICGIAGVGVFTGLAVVLLVDVGGRAGGNAGGTVDVVDEFDVVTPGDGSPDGIVAGNVICGIAGVEVFTGLAVVLLVDVGSPADGNAGGTVDVVAGSDVVTPGNGSPYGIVAGNVICGIAGVGVFTGLAVVLLVDVGSPADGNAGGTVDVVAGSDVVTPGNGSPDGIVAGNVICGIAGVGVFTGLAVVLLVDVGGRAGGNAGGTVDVVDEFDVVTPGDGSPDGIVAGNVICGIAGVEVFTGLAVVLLVDVGSPADGNAGGTVDVVAGSDVVIPGNGSPDGIVAGNVICGIAGVGVFTGLAVVLLVDVGSPADGNAGGTVDVVAGSDVVTPGNGSPDGIVAGNVICGIAGVGVFMGLAVVLLNDIEGSADGNAAGTVTEFEVVTPVGVVTRVDDTIVGVVVEDVTPVITVVETLEGSIIVVDDIGGRTGSDGDGTNGPDGYSSFHSLSYIFKISFVTLPFFLCVVSTSLNFRFKFFTFSSTVLSFESILFCTLLMLDDRFVDSVLI